MKHPMFDPNANQNGGGGIDYLADRTESGTQTQTGSTPSSDLIKGSGTQNQSAAVVDGKEITLSSGKKAVVKKGLGKHAIEAMKIANGDQSKYLPSLIAQLVTIDGNPVVMEDLEWLPLSDYVALQVEFAEQNF